jgi:hypothetical protein
MTNNETPIEWESQLHLDIRSVRALTGVLQYFHKMWPGSPARPAEEQEFVRELLKCMNKLELEYTFDCLEKKSD